MKDMIYRPEYFNPIFRPIFEQLSDKFGDACQVGTCVGNSGRCLNAEIVDPETCATVTIGLRKESTTRTAKLNKAQIRRIHEYLNSNASLKPSLPL